MKSISKKTSDRVCNHMNSDHLESVHNYLKHYCKVNNFGYAKMEEITSKSIKIKYDDKIASIDFEKEISEEDIHDTLVKMARDIK
tara:strand:- start:166 stop:420 length:255 start_codon:yes stop_codon:yes gene_type:complete